MKTYKIGRYYYKEISEKKYCELREHVVNTPYEHITVFTLTDVEGEPIKFFKRVKK